MRSSSPLHSRLILLVTFATSVALSAHAAKAPLTVQNIVDALQNITCYSAQAQFNVTMPQLNDDVVYRVQIQEQSAPVDTLLPCRYLIDWTLTSRQDPVSGFSAYFDGNHYRYSGERIQEYHMKADPVPFTGASGSQSPQGVQRTAQFANLLPCTIAEELTRMLTDERYDVTLHPDTTVAGTRCVALESRFKLNGATALEATYAFSRSSLMPLSILLENNPGSVSEQTVSVSYSDTRLESSCPPIAESTLMKRYTQAFENFRESNFRIQNLVGSKLPGFALLTTTGERYLRRTPDAFAAPTIVALLDASQGYTPQVVAALRDAVDALPFNADLIMAFTDKHVDAIEEIVPQLRPGEHLLMGATPLVRDCGAASLPAVLLTDASATVKNIILGYNNNLAADVIQQMAILSPTAPAAVAEAAKSSIDSSTDNSTITSMETVHFKSQPCHTYGTLPAVGSQAPAFNLTGADLSAVSSEALKGRTIVLNIFPSLDTEVCARSVRRFNEEAAGLDNTTVVCVSQDLPFAMGRFCTANGITNVTPASAFRSPQFGEKYGVMLVDGPLAGLLTRAVIIIAPDGTVRYRDLVNEITSEPDYEAALRVLKEKY